MKNITFDAFVKNELDMEDVYMIHIQENKFGNNFLDISCNCGGGRSDTIYVPLVMLDDLITALRDVKVDILVDMLYDGKVPDDLSQEDKREILGLLNFKQILDRERGQK